MRRNNCRLLTVALAVLLALSLCTGALADTFRLPPGLETIEEEAFSGDTSLDEVILQEGIQTILDAAFSNTSVTRINLPDSIEQIEGDPFAGTEDIILIAEEGTYPYEWAHMYQYPVTSTVVTGQWNGHTYQIILDGKSWEGANADCASRGGHMVSINSAEEQSYLESLISQIPIADRPYGFWLGAGLANPGDPWSNWITGEEIAYTNWETGQPDRNNGDELYILMAGVSTTDANGWTFHFGKWDDCLYQGDRFPYICETEPQARQTADTALSEEVQQTYFDFIMNGGYLKSGQEYFVPASKYDGMGALFALYDLNADGVPELIATNGYETHADAGGYAYAARGGKAVYLGTVPIDEYISQLTWYPGNTKYPGLFSAGGGMGYGWAQYITVRDGALVKEEVLTYEPTSSGGVRYSRSTSDTELYNLVRSDAESTGLEGFTPEWIQTNGWDAFLARFHYCNGSGFQGEIADTEEAAFRAWAADTIAEYYMSYAQHGESSAVFRQHQDFEFVQFDKVRDFIFRNGTKMADVRLDMEGILDGLYREYYLMALYKLHYEFDGYKETFSYIRYDDETEAEYKARMKPFYTRLLLDMLKKKAEIDPDSFDRLGRDTEGMFTLKMNESTGKLELVRDEDGLMANLEQMADTATAEAWTNFTIAAVELGIDVAREYLEIKNPSKDKYKKAMVDAVIDGAGQLAETLSSDLFTREKNKLENNLHQILLAEIANTKMQDYNRIIAYFENIYAGRDDTYVEYRSDANFLEVVRGLIDAAKEARYNASLDFAKQYLQEQYSEGIKLEKIMTDEEIVANLAAVFAKNVLKVFIAPLKTFLKEEVSEECRPLATAFQILFDVSEVLVEEGVRSELAKNRSFDAKGLDSTELLIKISQTILKDINAAIGDANTKNDPGYSGKDAAKAFQYEVMNILITELDDLYKLVSGYLDNGGYLSKAQLEEVQDKLWELLEKVGDAFVKSGKKWIWSMAFNAAGGMLMESATTADNIRDWAVIAGAIDIKDGILKTAQALADANLATEKNLENEQQISYCATSLLLAYKNSYPLENDLKMKLEYLMAIHGVGKTYDAIAAMAENPEILTLKELLDYTDMIMLQTEYDISGTQWLVQLLTQHENATFTSKYMKNLAKQIPEFWMERMTRKTAVTEYNQIVSLRNQWLEGWKDSYRDLANGSK